MAKEATKSNVPATTKAQANLPAEFAAQIAMDAGMGSEDATSDDMSVPFIKIAQKLSEELDKRNSKYIEGMEEGDFFNTASLVVYSGEQGFWFIPVKFIRKYLQWTPRDKGGGFGGEHGPEIMDKTTPGEKGENYLPNGDEIVITGTWFGLIVDDDGNLIDQAVISLAKTQLKKSKTLMTRLKSVALPHPSGKGKFNPPIFYNRVKVTSVPESNDQGNWMGWKFELSGSVFDFPNDTGGELYDAAKMLLEAVDSGRVKAADPSAAGNDDVGGADTGARDGRAQDPDKEIPF
jgi:hypothetical protein